jgi:D-glycero-D-manno-heptose 1,7-bisphosphate phosphatase
MRDYPSSHPIKRYNQAVFIDRDGTINVDSHFPHKPEELVLIPAVIEGLKLLTDLPLEIIVISNQAGISLNIFSKQQMSQFNQELLKQIVQHGARIDAFYYCPHLEPKHLQPGMERCLCSKPFPGMLFEAANDFKIDLTQSFMIGDRPSDIEAGQLAGCQTILVQRGTIHNGGDWVSIKPDFNARNLYEGALFIKSKLLMKV